MISVLGKRKERDNRKRKTALLCTTHTVYPYAGVCQPTCFTRVLVCVRMPAAAMLIDSYQIQKSKRAQASNKQIAANSEFKKKFNDQNQQLIAIELFVTKI